MISLQAGRVEDLARLGGAPDLFGERQRRAAVAIGHGDQHGAGVVVERQLLPLDRLRPFAARWPSAASSSGLNTSTRARDSSAALSSKDGFSVVAPTSVTVPSSITGRKESCCARLKRWISSTKSSVPCPVWRRPRACFEHLLEVGDAGEDGRDLLEAEVGLARQQAGDRGLAGARRPPEDERAERAGVKHPGERALGAQQMVLADDVGERLRPQPVGQRPRRCLVQPGCLKQRRHG